jgi:metacaspase-1
MLLPCVALAEVSAILVGVSDYDDTVGITDLDGPRNDVALLQEVLIRRGVTRIEVIADGVTGAPLPTRAAILDSLDAKARSVSPGDFVYIHFSGHGTQQRDLDGDEADGLDEVFLPADTGRAAPGTGVIPNAITDDEIGAAVDRIRAAGANVWFVLDSCHSGSGLRAGDPDVVARFVDPTLLGVEPGPARSVSDPLTASDLPGSESGGVIAFYAAQSSELAREVRMATPDTEGAFYGLFTSRLAARLDDPGVQSFRQLFQAVLRDMNDGSVPGAARLQTPLWEGDLIDAALFGDASTTGLRRFEVRGDQILAGQVHGFADGTLVGLVAEASAPADALIGWAQMEQTAATTAFLRPVAADCVPRLDAACPVAGVLPPQAAFGQVIARPVDLVIRFAVPVDLATGEQLPPDAPARMALESAIAASPEAVALSEADFDVEVGWDGQALWFGPRSTLQGKPVGLSWRAGAEPIDAVLTRIARAETLDRLLSALTGTGSILNPVPVRVVGQTAPVLARDLLPAETTVSPVRECTQAIQRRDPSGDGALIDAATFKQCDGLHFEAQGLTPGSRDVNRIHIDARYCIHAEHVRVEDTAAAVPLGDAMTLCSNCPDGYYAGDERLFIIVSEAEPNSPPLNLTGLIENCGVDFGTRSPRAAAVDAFLGTLAQGQATRGNLGAMGLSSLWVDRYRWTILPKELVLSPEALE